ncbi:lysine N(6)-hydroxylase/L-ornithine N(5)-oxygenase family protein [Halobacillus sp. Marseille-Q1614]|uniref:lysine N(6)-hydroxylase/L-ornithine N(5)-oxygenase family protein n=1 Tax=Halobacillus sp. Marseille-Q1614 TaxID=2709134 RepID=UPI00156E5FCA|nr:SidA/IucD/PvdA family monooxygenase [Halobacillus sp. Marseille-Q1614]
MSKPLYDVIGIGIGPYNLGLAALLDQTDLKGIFFDETPEFNWHPGMLIEKMDLQVPFIADLATFADPKSPYTFMNYLYEHNRMFPFFFHQHFKIPRQEYNDYLQWVAGQLDDIYFHHQVIDVIDHPEAFYEVVTKEIDTGRRKSHFAKHVVMGTGSKPLILDGMDGLPEEDVIHTSRYMYEREQLLHAKDVTVVGSGQSALEILLDLLEEQRRNDMKLTLLSRTGGLFQLDQAKFAQEFFTPEYVDYYHSLSFEQRQKNLETLGALRKGIDPDTLTRLYTNLYHKTAGGQDSRVTINPMTEVKSIEKSSSGYKLHCEQWQEELEYTYQTEKVILATGYKPHIPEWFMERFKDKIEWDDEKAYKVTRDYQLVFKEPRSRHFFTLTNLVPSHGAGATNLGLSVQRNVHIINTIAGKELYKNQEQTAFQTFSMQNYT